ncbi:MAG: hypothetical protein NTU89_00905 [Candidatus Dependentiae bacterium]|nr:hypothetical protein [Candidatus Dependentiae bacterium]
MGFLYKKTLIRHSILLGLFTSANLFGGFFNNSCSHKPVRISIASKKFIQEVLPLAQDLGLRSFSDWTDTMKNKEFFVKSDIEKLQSILREEKQELFNLLSSSSDDRLNAAVSQRAKGNYWGNQQSNGLENLLKILSGKLTGLNARGFEHDLGQLKNFIDSIENRGCFMENRQEKKIKALGYLTTIISMVSSFDGVFVTDYDVFVLASSAQAIFLVACDVKN